MVICRKLYWTWMKLRSELLTIHHDTVVHLVAPQIRLVDLSKQESHIHNIYYSSEWLRLKLRLLISIKSMNCKKNYIQNIILVLVFILFSRRILLLLLDYVHLGVNLYRVLFWLFFYLVINLFSKLPIHLHSGDCIRFNAKHTVHMYIYQGSGEVMTEYSTQAFFHRTYSR
jgi:hypothetical protein